MWGRNLPLVWHWLIQLLVLLYKPWFQYFTEPHHVIFRTFKHQNNFSGLFQALKFEGIKFSGCRCGNRVPILHNALSCTFRQVCVHSHDVICDFLQHDLVFNWVCWVPYIARLLNFLDMLTCLHVKCKCAQWL